MRERFTLLLFSAAVRHKRECVSVLPTTDAYEGANRTRGRAGQGGKVAVSVRYTDQC